MRSLSLWVVMLFCASTGLADVFHVDTPIDFPDKVPGDGRCAATTGQCSLRAAIQEANATPGVDRVEIPAGTFTLMRPGTGEDAALDGDLDITEAVWIKGQGPDQTVIDGNGIDRVFHIPAGGGAEGLIEISGVTIRGGDVKNTVQPDQENRGGGIFDAESSADLSIWSCAILDNLGSIQGGGIRHRGTLEIDECTLTGNSATFGGAIKTGGFSTLRLTNSALYANSVGNNGAAIDASSNAEVMLENCTVGASTSGDAIYLTGTDLSINNCTVVAATGEPAFTFSSDGSNDLAFSNTIIVDGGTDSCVFYSAASRSLGYNLTSDASCGLNGPQDLENRDPLLGPLADNGGGWTHALLQGSPAIDAGDDALCPDRDQRNQPRPIDGDGIGGAVCDIGAFETEYLPEPSQAVLSLVAFGLLALLRRRRQRERGLPPGSRPARRRWVAVWLTALLSASGAHGAVFQVTNFSDLPDEDPGDGFCSVAGTKLCTLRAAIQETNALSGADKVQLQSGTYLLTRTGVDEDAAATGDLDITDELRLTGNGADETTIDGNGIDRVFHIPFGDGAAGLVHMEGITIRGGDAKNTNQPEDYRDGGGVYNGDPLVRLSLLACVVIDNLAGHEGGGISHRGTLEIDKCTLTGNGGPAFGGAINTNNFGTLRLTNSTLYANSVGTSGAAIHANSNSGVMLENCTVSANTGGDAIYLSNVDLSVNSTTVVAGTGEAAFGLYSYDGSDILAFSNTIIVDGGTDACILGGAADSQSFGYNITSDASCHLSGPTDLENSDPLLGPLADNGGTGLTHDLDPASPAIDAGDDIWCPDVDQRDEPRPADGDGDGEAVCDIGAVETEYVPEPSQAALLAAALTTLWLLRRISPRPLSHGTPKGC